MRWDRRSRAFVVDNLFSIECEELDDLVAVLEEGMHLDSKILRYQLLACDDFSGLKNRAIGHHNMNEHSSRSHTILTVHIHSEEKASSEDNKGVYITRHGLCIFDPWAIHISPKPRTSCQFQARSISSTSLVQR